MKRIRNNALLYRGCFFGYDNHNGTNLYNLVSIRRVHSPSLNTAQLDVFVYKACQDFSVKLQSISFADAWKKLIHSRMIISGRPIHNRPNIN